MARDNDAAGTISCDAFPVKYNTAVHTPSSQCCAGYQSTARMPDRQPASARRLEARVTLAALLRGLRTNQGANTALRPSALMMGRMMPAKLQLWN